MPCITVGRGNSAPDPQAGLVAFVLTERRADMKIKDHSTERAWFTPTST